ncbi:serine hydrolase [Fodinicola feengrottensis]|uniref:Serine hydrolase domain-containing protein n=1 Tax=Fodinicola feengrottensis TaxID=435914 RepID=A0ABN2H0W4_9ACTN|nr:serine hydrolase [Fodinicola feengrottensis]
MKRFAALAIGVTTLVSATLSGALPASASPDWPGSARGFDQPYSGFASPWTTLHTGSPRQAGMTASELDKLRPSLSAFLQKQANGFPMYPGATWIVGHDGTIVDREAVGDAVKYADATNELPADQQIPARTNTIYDLASMTKLFTSILIVQLIQSGKVGLENPVAQYVPEFADGGKQAVTVRMLLTHTSGLPSGLPLWSAYPDPASRLDAAVRAKLTAPPGTRYLYSDLSMINLGVLAERVTGKKLDQLVRERITGPLGMHDTMYNPPASLQPRIAATEFQANPPRGMVWGSVHDENAWSLGGVAGHAGLFSTVDDLAILSQTLLNGGTYRGYHMLSPQSVHTMFTNYNPTLTDPEAQHGLGFELNHRWYMDALSSPETAGHTGYTGTSIVIDPLSHTFEILLTNRVHPSRNWGSTNPSRLAAARYTAEALPVHPADGPDEWFAGYGDKRTSGLTLPVSQPGKLGFDLFVDTEADSDILSLTVSTDNGTTWTALPFSATSPAIGAATYQNGQISGFTGRRWMKATADLSTLSGPALVRWQYVTDPSEEGRGVYVDGVRESDGHRTLVDTERQPWLLQADGFTRTDH